ncbi:MAG: hypothetical protein NT123_21650 [Proteobacteria bacterium]|nr:hypothetical protein [Pseudomonadota bacterium]
MLTMRLLLTSIFLVFVAACTPVQAQGKYPQKAGAHHRAFPS